MTYVYFNNNKINNIINNNNNISNNVTNNKQWYKNVLRNIMLKQGPKHKDKKSFGLVCNAHCLTNRPVAFVTGGSLASVHFVYVAHPMADLLPANWVTHPMPVLGHSSPTHYILILIIAKIKQIRSNIFHQFKTELPVIALIFFPFLFKTTFSEIFLVQQTDWI